MLSVSTFFPVRRDFKADAVKFAMERGTFTSTVHKKKLDEKIKLLGSQNLAN